MKYAAILFIVLSFYSPIKCQKLAHIYYDSAWRITIKEFAVYFRAGIIDKKLKFNGEVKDFYRSGQLNMKGYYAGGAKLDTFYFYYPNGQLMERGLYLDNKRYGIWSFFYSNGQLKQKVVFNDWFRIVLEFYDTKGNPLIAKGTGEWNYKYYDEVLRSNVRIEGKFKDSLRYGHWDFYHDDKLACREEYKKGRLQKTTWYNNLGVWMVNLNEHSKIPEREKFKRIPNWAANKYASIEAYPWLKKLPHVDSTVFPVDTPAIYPGGLDSLETHLLRKIETKKWFAKTDKKMYAFHSFFIDPQGNLKFKDKPSALPGEHQFLNLVTKALKLLPKWEPAKRGNKNVEHFFVINVILEEQKPKIYFLISNNEVNNKELIWWDRLNKNDIINNY